MLDKAKNKRKISNNLKDLGLQDKKISNIVTDLGPQDKKLKKQPE